MIIRDEDNIRRVLNSAARLAETYSGMVDESHKIDGRLVYIGALGNAEYQMGWRDALKWILEEISASGSV